MDPSRDLGRFLLILGAAIALVGLVLTLGSRFPLRLGRLPGDIVFRRENFTLYLPIATSVLLSLILTVVFWLLKRR